MLPTPLKVELNILCCILGDCGCTAIFSDVAPSLAFCRSVEDECRNPAYSTIISHEYGHYIGRFLIGETDYGAFHEGYASSLAMMLHDTGIIGQDQYITPSGPVHAAEPGSSDVTYPACLASAHDSGDLLARAWWDIRNNIDPPVGLPIDAARHLFVAWTLITSGGADPHGDCPTRPLFGGGTGPRYQPADGDTFLEVLVADDTDGNLSNGTPNEDAICAAFAARGIALPANVGACEESAGGGGCRTDLNLDGALDFFDFLAFQDLFGAADPRADFTGDGSLDFFDFLAFENEFAAGCW